jgi:hypothetical protein
MMHHEWVNPLRAVGLLFVVAGGLRAQPSATPTAKDVAGTYAARTQHMFSQRPGCWLEVAPVAADSVRLQIRCQNPAPGHHIGVVEARLHFDDGKVIYETDRFAGHCRIGVTFTRDRAVVTHEGIGADRSSACGFGAYVDVSDTYHRLSTRRPRFELFPIERSSAPPRR